MVKSKIYIDKIYWERVQLFVEGHSENLDLTKSKFVLRNLTETRILKANDVKIDDNKFVCRFNVAILDDGYYLPQDKYLLVNEQDFSYIAELNPEVINDAYQLLKEDEEEQYNEIETQNGKINYLLQSYLKEFKKGGNSKKTIYTITPEISSDVNEFVFDVNVTMPKPKQLFIVRKYKEVNKKIRKYSFNIRKFVFQTIFNTTKFFHLKKGKTVLFTSDSRGTMSGNFKYIYDEMLRQNLDQKYNIHTIFKANITDRRGLIDKFRLPYLLGKADYIFVDDFHPLIYTVRFRRSQEVIQVWHAVGAFKTVGFSRTGKKGGPFIDSLNHRSYTKAYVSSETDIPFYAEAFGIKEKNVVPTGVPRTDVLFDEDYAKSIRREMEDELPIIKGKKVILFAPTFRGNGHGTAHYPFFKIDFERLAKYCEEHNAVVLFKMHPFVKNRLNISNQHQKYFVDVSDFREVNDILFITDLLISDYSSLIYEFAVFKRPMIFYAFDLEDYITTRDFYEPYESFVPGKIVQSFDELMDALNNENYDEQKVVPFLDKHFKYQDGRSSERLVRDLFGS
ncbi:CDP-glycerol glycerophosphotransferase family protein [Staphylococcus simiae]|uniref:teichoic acid ribitol-phosphate polymerase TarL n=1 Tax=Staphylococcus simiae TaxID=308354 RepID=UPI001A95707E|nr:teichoic acid ribitol-phosphate polymerase TarL [Staphylococcus simiae]MBO1199410.1 CDP-glycerol glycerophosphotransferase family protein [Staphylococcus simiae]MBO1201854.1 CDP-glycerol glycerophosphotransferase family protein [Staphylococcus simiae]MBO1204068.1 CDP-glycerol glycerophosphotransferase family protein [Staphylococcus simiae]MBO1211122.1 CDP-glycerol glycerophosphotransferase family protein [Staphylococcus simiae]MBO1230318.1 CDP-glycerol glycerophosphotransferase family prote